MSGGMEDLARMLGRLREETPEVERKVRPPEPPAGDAMPHGVPWTHGPGITSRNRRPLAEPAAGPAPEHHGSLIWAENKETLIFGLLISVLASALGVIGSYPYLVLFGSVAFMLFAVASFLMLVGYYFNSRRRGAPEFGANEKIERLRRKIEALEMRSPGGQSFSAAPAQDGAREKELERRIEELRTIVISLSRAVETPGRR
ncbi:MAG: hypothetical protein FD189_767 [Elusimicrobia bacterium]|nr:MAG: hypothetical protein FD154_698 [Elusimicrobiota bacterium]KAF0157013.1 MAG: hypothetical protein FD189_767 [Elusimicrobiota bacterium]